MDPLTRTPLPGHGPLYSSFPWSNYVLSKTPTIPQPVENVNNLTLRTLSIESVDQRIDRSQLFKPSGQTVFNPAPRPDTIASKRELLITACSRLPPRGG